MARRRRVQRASRGALGAGEGTVRATGADRGRRATVAGTHARRSVERGGGWAHALIGGLAGGTARGWARRGTILAC